jgi:hypothetical protein
MASIRAAMICPPRTVLDTLVTVDDQQLPKKQKQVLKRAKYELRDVFGRALANRQAQSFAD